MSWGEDVSPVNLQDQVSGIKMVSGFIGTCGLHVAPREPRGNGVVTASGYGYGHADRTSALSARAEMPGTRRMQHRN